MVTSKLDSIWAEIDCAGFRRDAKNCEKCEERFRCWTSNGFIIKPERLALERDVDIDRLRLEAYVPNCFLCSDMTGAEVFIHMYDTCRGLFDTFRGTIIEQYITAIENKPMWVELIAVHKCRF